MCSCWQLHTETTWHHVVSSLWPLYEAKNNFTRKVQYAGSAYVDRLSPHWPTRHRKRCQCLPRGIFLDTIWTCDQKVLQKGLPEHPALEDGDFFVKPEARNKTLYCSCWSTFEVPCEYQRRTSTRTSRWQFCCINWKWRRLWNHQIRHVVLHNTVEYGVHFACNENRECYACCPRKKKKRINSAPSSM